MLGHRVVGSWIVTSSAVLAPALAVALLAAFGCGDDDDVVPDDAGAPDDGGTPTDARRPRPDAGPPPLDDTPSKGPWVIRPDVDRVTVMWESRLAPPTASVTATPEAGGDAVEAVGETTAAEVTLSYDTPIVDEPDLAGTFYMNSVEVSGLAPATCYRYTLVGYPEWGGRFCTMHAPDDHDTPFSFYVIGDTNPVLTHTQALFDASTPSDTDFVVHAGDLQYYMSLLETWQTWFRLMPDLLEAGAFMPCVGNHELELDGELEQYYERFFPSPGSDGDAIRYHFENGGVHFFSISTEHDTAPGSDQYDWLVARLDEVEALPTYRFSIVFFHRPYYTVGDSAPNLARRADLDPVFQSHRVPLVLTGHVHGYERFEVGNVTYITSGGGGGALGNVDELIADYPEDAALRVASGSFFQTMTVTIESNTIRATVTDDVGVVRDEFEHLVE